MRILHVINSLEGGGAERLISELLPSLKAEGLHVELLVLSSQDAVFDQVLKDAEIVFNYLSDKQVSFNPFVIFKLSKHISRYDIVHSHLFPSQYLLVFANMLLKNKVKLITTEHSTNNKRRKYSFLRPLEKFIYSAYDLVVSISEATQTALKQNLGNIQQGKYVVVENGIKISSFSNAKPYVLSEISQLLDGNSKVLIMVAGFNKAKDHKTLIEAMRHLSEEYKLLLIGVGPLMGKARSLVKKYQLDDRVVFLGFRKDVAGLMKSSYISILSSNWEGFGLVSLEAMAAGVPVIASNVKGLKEVVQNAGLLFESGNEHSLVRVIQDLEENNDLRLQVIERQSVKVLNYDIKRSTLEYTHLYLSLMGENG